MEQLKEGNLFENQLRIRKKATRILLWQDNTDQPFLDRMKGIEELVYFISSVRQSLDQGELAVTKCSCGRVKSIQLDEKVYLKISGSDPKGLFAYGRIIPADREVQLNRTGVDYKDFSSAYIAYHSKDSKDYHVAVEIEGIVDHTHPLRLSELNNNPVFVNSHWNYRSSSRLPERYIRLINFFWREHLGRKSLSGNASVKFKQDLIISSPEDLPDGVFTKANFLNILFNNAINSFHYQNYEDCIEGLSDSLYLLEGLSFQHKYIGLSLLKLGLIESGIRELRNALNLFMDEIDWSGYQEIQRILEDVDLGISANFAIDNLSIDKLLEDCRKPQELVGFSRSGQQKFREKLLEAYGGRCAVTGCNVEKTLQAAHIIPYTGEHSNITANGVLLRSDIHALFDDGQLKVNPQTLCLEIGTDLQGSIYSDFHEKQLEVPRDKSAQPSRLYLGWRYENYWNYILSRRKESLQLVP